jgi:hypothetical protein
VQLLTSGHGQRFALFRSAVTGLRDEEKRGMKVQSTCAGLMVVAGLISVSASANHRVSARATAEIMKEKSAPALPPFHDVLADEVLEEL